jgi:hypothetical protein
MLTLYRIMLYLYPVAYRNEFGEEMIEVFQEAKSEAWQKRLAARIAFCAREARGLVSGALQEHLRVPIGGDFLRAFLSRRFTMRSEFRFPKATVALMAVILAAVVWTIEKAKAISASVPHTDPQVGPISPEQITIVPTLLLVTVMAVAAGMLGWAVLYALRRSGMQKFSEFKSSRGV